VCGVGAARSGAERSGASGQGPAAARRRRRQGCSIPRTNTPRPRPQSARPGPRSAGHSAPRAARAPVSPVGSASASAAPPPPPPPPSPPSAPPPLLASPKSDSLARPDASSSTLLGFTSRCSTGGEHAAHAASALATCGGFCQWGGARGFGDRAPRRPEPRAEAEGRRRQKPIQARQRKAAVLGTLCPGPGAARTPCPAHARGDRQHAHAARTSSALCRRSLSGHRSCRHAPPIARAARSRAASVPPGSSSVTIQQRSSA
jgi:hypothetical protein